MGMERRYLQRPVEVRQLTGQKTKNIVGYAAQFAPARSEDLGGFVEEIAPSAFDNALRNHSDVRGLYNHDVNYVLGRTKSGTLSLTKDATGLHYDITSPGTQWANDLMITMERGDVDQSSFGFVCNKDSWRVENDGTVVRTLEDVSLYDVSVVTYPAYTGSSAQVRSLFPDNEGSIPTEIAAKVEETRAKQTREKRYGQVLSAVGAQKWAIQPEKLETICALLNARAEGIEATEDEIRAALAMQHGDTPENTSSVTVIPVYGVISQRMSMFGDFSGGTSCEAISKQLKAALADDSIKTIVLDVDSPGGTVTGVPELAAEIYSARSKKEIIAVANGLAASAAYWIASAASKVVCIPSGEVGSVGVYTTHQDVSAAMDKQGVKITYIQAGKYKTDGNPYEPLSESARADLQDGVDKFYQMFTKGVAGGRGVDQDTVLKDFGQGRCLMAEDALKAGMIDEIATLDQVLAGLAAVETAPDPLTFSGDPIVPEQTNAHVAKLEVRAKSKQKTKRVDGEDLPKENFAYQGSDQLVDWKLPIKFSDEAKTKTHIRNAISQWPKTDMPNAAEKKRARSRIKAATKEHGIDLAPGDLALTGPAETRAAGAQPGDDDYYDTCQCDCNACMAGNCEHCEDPKCNDDACMCCGFDRNAEASAHSAPVAAPQDLNACACDCNGCANGNCADCSDDNCDDPFCDHTEEDDNEDDNDEDSDGDDDVLRMQLQLAQAVALATRSRDSVGR